MCMVWRRAPSSRPGAAGRGRGGARFQPHPVTLKLQDGRTLDGTLTSQNAFSATVWTPDGKFHLLARDGDNYSERAIEPKQDWTSYDGNYNGNRYSRLEQVNTNSVQRLAPAWVFPVPGAPRLEVTPVVIDGVMYITAANEAYALDAVTGRQIWSFRTPRTAGLLGEAGGGANRGVAVAGNRVFMITDNAHILALDRGTGRKLWDTTMADVKEGYSATAAPLAVGDLVISGIAGGEEGARGFIDAYDAATGKRVWRFYSIPARGEKGSETWVGNALEHGCGATWLTGSYDPDLATLYWGVGNPCPDYNGDERKGDNLYTASMVALDVKTGQLKWYFQFTPHDTHDWDASEPMILADEQWEGRPRKMLMQGEPQRLFLRAGPDQRGVCCWRSRFEGELGDGVRQGRASDIVPEHFESSRGRDHGVRRRHQLAGGQSSIPSRSCSTARGEGCGVFKKNPAPIQVGRALLRRHVGGAAGNAERSYIRAIDIHTGDKAWEYPLAGASEGRARSRRRAGWCFSGRRRGRSRR